MGIIRDSVYVLSLDTIVSIVLINITFPATVYLSGFLVFFLEVLCCIKGRFSNIKANIH